MWNIWCSRVTACILSFQYEWVLAEYLQGGRCQYSTQLPVFCVPTFTRTWVRGFLRRPHKEAPVSQATVVRFCLVARRRCPLERRDFKSSFNVEAHSSDAVRCLPNVLKISTKSMKVWFKNSPRQWKNIGQRWRDAAAKCWTFPGHPVRWLSCFQAPQGTWLYDFSTF